VSVAQKASRAVKTLKKPQYSAAVHLLYEPAQNIAMQISAKTTHKSTHKVVMPL
jgi:hypothetical protein